MSFNAGLTIDVPFKEGLTTDVPFKAGLTIDVPFKAGLTISMYLNVWPMQTNKILTDKLHALYMNQDLYFC